MDECRLIDCHIPCPTGIIQAGIGVGVVRRIEVVQQDITFGAYQQTVGIAVGGVISPGCAVKGHACSSAGVIDIHAVAVIRSNKVADRIRFDSVTIRNNFIDRHQAFGADLQPIFAVPVECAGIDRDGIGCGEGIIVEPCTGSVIGWAAVSGRDQCGPDRYPRLSRCIHIGERDRAFGIHLQTGAIGLVMIELAVRDRPRYQLPSLVHTQLPDPVKVSCDQQVSAIKPWYLLPLVVTLLAVKRPFVTSAIPTPPNSLSISM